MDHSLNILAAVAVTFFVAGIVKGVTGMGLPTVAMGVLGALMSPLSAASLLPNPVLCYECLAVGDWTKFHRFDRQTLANDAWSFGRHVSRGRALD